MLAGFTVINSVRNICLTASLCFELFTILPTSKITHTPPFNGEKKATNSNKQSHYNRCNNMRVHSYKCFKNPVNIRNGYWKSNIGLYQCIKQLCMQLKTDKCTQKIKQTKQTPLKVPLCHKSSLSAQSVLIISGWRLTWPPHKAQRGRELDTCVAASSSNECRFIPRLSSHPSPHQQCHLERGPCWRERARDE